MDDSAYYLPKHVFLCLADGHYVFLNLRSDEYLCLGRAHTDAAKWLLNGCRAFSECSADFEVREGLSSEVTNVAQALLKKGLLVRGASDAKPPTPVCLGTPVASLMEDRDRPRSNIGPGHVFSFLVASTAAAWTLRWQSIEQTVLAVQRRKAAKALANTAVDQAVVADLFEIFRALRPLYPRPYLCLFDSLALVHFLARYSLFPEWVYGVKLEPFGAHCWVQAGDLVLNEILDTVRYYTPIMSV